MGGGSFAGWLSTGEGKWAVALKSLIRLGCLVQRLTDYTVATVNSHLPIALDNQPANLCTSRKHSKPAYKPIIWCTSKQPHTQEMEAYPGPVTQRGTA